MKILLIIWAVIIGLILLGFSLQAIRWQLMPFLKDKMAERKNKKLSKK